MAVAVVGGSLTAAERPAKAVTQAGGVVPMTLILSALVLCAVGVMPEAHAKTPGEVDIGETVPEATLQGLNGPSRKLSEFHGKPLIINVWASWCGPCRKEMASLERLAWLKRARHFNIIGVSTDDDPAQAKTWLKQSNATITQFIDTGLQMENMLGASRLPLTVLLERRRPSGRQDVWRPRMGQPGILGTDPQSLPNATPHVPMPACGRL